MTDDRTFTDTELEAAVAAISDPAALSEAQDVVMRTAPALQRVLSIALQEGGWFDLAQDQALYEATGKEDPGDRLREVRTLLAEETRLGMLAGVAVGFELARVLARGPDGDGAEAQTTTQEE